MVCRSSGGVPRPGCHGGNARHGSKGKLRGTAARAAYDDIVGRTSAPPIRVHVGDDEVLLDNSLRYVRRSVAAGVDATVDVWQGMPHGFVGKVGRVEASAEALKAIGTFLSARFAYRSFVTISTP